MIEVQGYWPPEFAPVVARFKENFIDHGEQGAALAVFHRGQPLLSIWAGTRVNKNAGISAAHWQEDTAVNIFSAGKGLVALCVLQLVASGKLDLDAPIARYWSEFSQQGKEQITLRQVLCHRAGLSAFHQRRQDNDIYDWSTIVNAIVVDGPWWEPGSEQGYSPFLFGWILGEVIRRVSGCTSFNDYFQTAIAGPLGAQCVFGVADDQLAVVADTGPLKSSLAVLAATDADSASLGKLMKADPRGVTNRAFANPMTLMTSVNSTAWRQAQIPAANGHASARGLAAIYGALAAGQLLAEPSRPLCWTEQSAGLDRTLGVPLRFSHGFMLSQDREDCRFGRGARAFGHPGAGGSLGFADPDYQLGFGYVTNRLGPSLLIDPRPRRLIDSLYAIPELAL